jgi:hypothetical protein
MIWTDLVSHKLHLVLRSSLVRLARLFCIRKNPADVHQQTGEPSSKGSKASSMRHCFGFVRCNANGLQLVGPWSGHQSLPTWFAVLLTIMADLLTHFSAKCNLQSSESVPHRERPHPGKATAPLSLIEHGIISPVGSKHLSIHPSTCPGKQILYHQFGLLWHLYHSHARSIALLEYNH